MPQDRIVNLIGNTPLVSVSGTCSRAILPEEYIVENWIIAFSSYVFGSIKIVKVEPSFP